MNEYYSGMMLRVTTLTVDRRPSVLGTLQLAQGVL